MCPPPGLPWESLHPIWPSLVLHQRPSEVTAESFLNIQPPWVCGFSVARTCCSGCLETFCFSHMILGQGEAAPGPASLTSSFSALVGQGAWWHTPASGPGHQADVLFSLSAGFMQGPPRVFQMCLHLSASVIILKEFFPAFYLMPGPGFGNSEVKNWPHWPLPSAVTLS